MRKSANGHDGDGKLQRVLVIGYNTRHIICSAKRAGYYVESVSHYEDADLLKCGDVTRFIRDEFAGVITDGEYADVKRLVRGLDYDYAILAAGFETLGIPRAVGNPPALADFVNDKHKLRGALESLGYPVPRHFGLDDHIPFPVILKPSHGAGGFKNVLVKDSEHLERAIANYQENGVDQFVIEEYVQGTDASTSVLSTGEHATTIAVNEQLIGLKELGALRRFSFCGSLTPLRTSYAHELSQLSSSVAVDLGLVGTNGLDFILGRNGPVIIEINPRFQGTLDTIEASLDINLVDAHIRCCQGELMPPPLYRRFACRMISFAQHDVVVTQTCAHPNYMDVPRKGTHIERAKPIISALGCGKSRDLAFSNAMRYIRATKSIYSNEQFPLMQ
ncbi:MAG: ATP-grasp domain-containing protein [Euryarchaeota archaeon]|nr:ATP-grasp domain-containing protein [Euryarchaeota archaeon]